MPDNNRLNNNIPSRPPLGRGQKISAVILGIFAVAVIGMWFAQFRKNILSPLRSPVASGNLSAQEAPNSDDALRGKDTDNDGLSDWDELNLYKTSPYLEDTDSDGISDQVEISGGKDPNCPEGQNCYGIQPTKDGNTAAPTGNNTGGNVENNLNNLSGQLNQLKVDSNTNSTEELQKVLKGETDAASLRKMLLNAGMDKAMLDKISDENLMKTYQETLKK